MINGTCLSKKDFFELMKYFDKISGKRNSSSQFETSFRLNENREVKKLKMKFSDAAAVVFNVVVVCVLVVVCSVATASAASFPVKQFPLKQYQT